MCAGLRIIPTLGKIERWHQALNNRIPLDNYYLAGDPERRLRPPVRSVTKSSILRSGSNPRKRSGSYQDQHTRQPKLPGTPKIEKAGGGHDFLD
jgi:hypothetical protein